MGTRERILDKALEMFNAHGIEYVGMRELAALLNMRVSNITYYFPTKDELVHELSIGLRELNSKTIVKNENLSLPAFMDMLKTVFENHNRYRCLMLSFVHLMQQNPKMAERYKKTEKLRNDTLRANLLSLKKHKYISLKSSRDADRLVSTLSLIVRFWISEATISYRHLDTDRQIAHYLGMIAGIFRQYATEKGLKALKKYL